MDIVEEEVLMMGVVVIILVLRRRNAFIENDFYEKRVKLCYRFLEKLRT